MNMLINVRIEVRAHTMTSRMNSTNSLNKLMFVFPLNLCLTAKWVYQVYYESLEKANKPQQQQFTRRG